MKVLVAQSEHKNSINIILIKTILVREWSLLLANQLTKISFLIKNHCMIAQFLRAKYQQSIRHFFWAQTCFTGEDKMLVGKNYSLTRRPRLIQGKALVLDLVSSRLYPPICLKSFLYRKKTEVPHIAEFYLCSTA